MSGVGGSSLGRAVGGCLVLAALASCGNVGPAANGATNPRLAVVDPGPSGLVPVADRQPVPELAGGGLDGQPLDVAASRGKVVVLNFWASWCAPCRAEAPNLKAVYDRTRARGVDFLGVNVKDDLNAARRFEEVRGVDYPSVFDQPGVLLTRFRRYAPQTPPTTLILDRQGRVAVRLLGGQTEAELSGPLEAVLAEPS